MKDLILSPEQKQMIEANSGSKISELDEDGLNKFLKMLIIKTHLDCGMRADDEMIKLSLPELIKDFRAYFFNFTPSQIHLAFKLGVDKEFGEWFGLNNKTYRQWMKGFLGSPKRLEANKIKWKMEKPEEVKKIDMAESEKNRLAFEQVKRYFIENKKAPYMADWDRCLKHLEEAGEIKDTNEEKRMFMDNVVEELKAHINETAKNRFHREDMLTQWTDVKVKQECRKRRCVIYFESKQN